MKDEIPKTEQEKNEIINSHLSMNTGIVSCIILFYAVIRDFLILFFMLFSIKIKWSKWSDCIFGMFVLIFYLVSIKIDLCSKADNKKNLRDAIDIFTFIAIIIFAIESIIIPFIEIIDKCDIIIAIVIISTLLCLCIIVLGWTFFFKSDKKCNTD